LLLQTTNRKQYIAYRPFPVTLSDLQILIYLPSGSFSYFKHFRILFRTVLQQLIRLERWSLLGYIFCWSLLIVGLCADYQVEDSDIHVVGLLSCRSLVFIIHRWWRDWRWQSPLTLIPRQFYTSAL